MNEARTLLAELYRFAPSDAFVTLSTPHADGSDGFPTRWYRAGDIDRMISHAARATNAELHVYFSIGAGEQRGQRHSSESIASLGALWIEIDMVAPGHHKASDVDLAPDLDAAFELLGEFPRPASIIVHSGGGIQAYWLLSKALEGRAIASALGAWKRTWRKIANACPWSAAIGVETVDAARVYRLPGSRNVKTNPPKPVQLLECHPDRRHKIDGLLELSPKPIIAVDESLHLSKPQQSDEVTALNTRDRVDGVLRALRTAPEGQRNAMENWAAHMLGRFVASSWCADYMRTRSGLDREWLDAATSRPSDKSESQLENVFTSGFEAGLQDPLPEPEPLVMKLASRSLIAKLKSGEAPPHCPPREYETTDIGNAGRLVALYGSELRHCTDLGTWLAWDGTRWQRDNTHRAQFFGKRTARGIYAEAAALAEHDEKGAPRLAKWAQSSSSKPRITAMLELARDELAITPSQLDEDRAVLNCPNGTLDLASGSLRAHDPDDLLTFVTTTSFQDDADVVGDGAALWSSYLDHATGGDGEFQAYLQRAVGYSLHGEPSEDCLFFIHGPAGTGKSTLLEAIHGVLGDYAATIDANALLRSRDSGGNQPEIAKLPGRRFVSCEEIDRGRRLAEGLVKNITGGRTISVAAKYQAPIEFRPSFTLWIAANDRPRVRDDDSGIWRRIRVIPFDRPVPKDQIDTELREKLRTIAGPAILAWAVRGYQLYRAFGLGECERVSLATEEYRNSEDPLSGWLAECCHLDPEAIAGLSELWSSYLSWFSMSGERNQLNKRDWTARLESMGCARDRDSSHRFWKGIGLLSPAYDRNDGNDN